MSDSIDYKAQWSIHQNKENNHQVLLGEKAKTSIVSISQLRKDALAKQKQREEQWVDLVIFSPRSIHQEVIHHITHLFYEINQYRLEKERREKDEKVLKKLLEEQGTKTQEVVEKEGGKTRELVDAKGDEVIETVAGVGVKVDKLGAELANVAKGLSDEVAEKVTQEIMKTIEKAQVSNSRITEGDIPTAITLDDKFASVASTAASTEATEEEIDEKRYSKFKSTLGRFSTINIPFGGRKNHGGAN